MPQQCCQFMLRKRAWGSLQFGIRTISQKRVLYTCIYKNTYFCLISALLPLLLFVLWQNSLQTIILILILYMLEKLFWKVLRDNLCFCLKTPTVITLFSLTAATIFVIVASEVGSSTHLLLKRCYDGKKKVWKA